MKKNIILATTFGILAIASVASAESDKKPEYRQMIDEGGLPLQAREDKRVEQKREMEREHIASSTGIRGIKMADMSSTTRREKMEDRKEAMEDRRASTTEKRVENMKDRGEKMIDNRIDSLNKLIERIAGMDRVSDGTQTSLIDSLKAEIVKLTAQKAAILAGTATSTIKDDIKSVRSGERVFALVEPRARIIASADRVFDIVKDLNTVYAKVGARIASSTTVTASTSALMSDAATQIALAQSKAQSATDLVKNLVADNASTTVAISNQNILQQARVTLADAQKAVNNARQDFHQIVNIVTKK